MSIWLLANANDSHYIRCMIICICHRISDRDITRAVREGCASFDELQDETRVATACGACHHSAHHSFHAQAAAGCGRSGGAQAGHAALQMAGG